MSYAFQYDEDDTGLCSLEDYPFAMHRHWFYGCKRYMAYCEPLKHTKVAKYVNVTATEEALTAAIATQPVSVAVTAGGVNWQFYSSGVMDESCEDEVDHGILAVGYGHYDPRNDPEFVEGTDSTQSAMDYYLVKNSWGSWWGMSGCEFCMYVCSITYNLEYSYFIDFPLFRYEIRKEHWARERDLLYSQSGIETYLEGRRLMMHLDFMLVCVRNVE
jgi:hypothetical protein